MGRRSKSRRRKMNAKPYQSCFAKDPSVERATPVIRGEVEMTSQFTTNHAIPRYAIDPRTGIVMKL
jgi:hypothetical protein